ncbi:MAG: hypothetical protein ACREAY_00125 [Nitrososphaera sp.]|uniref:hypothetical protein n=1 Tax=Nitrososphaera sp. TaxID=1971748 RepID=UPI003D7002F4
MDFKNRLILFFILIAVIPIAALSVVFTITVIEFKEQISNVYSGFVSNMAILQKNKGDLLAMRADLVQYTSSQDAGQKASAITHMQGLKSSIAGIAGDYKMIKDLPGGFEPPGVIIQPVSSFNVAKLASDETVVANRITQQWKDYSTKADDLAILASDPNFASQASATAGQLIVLNDRLVESYDALVELNTQIGEASREQSQQVMQVAFFYGGLASAISAACATAAAILVSKRVVLGDLVRMSKLDLIETTLRDLIGGGADALVGMIKSQMSEEAGTPMPAQREVQTAFVQSASEDVIIGKSRAKPYDEAKPGRPSGAFVDEQVPQNESPAGPDYAGKLVMLNAGSKPGAGATAVLDRLFSGKNLVVLTRKGSNIYHRAQGKAVIVCVLGQGALGKERVIPSANEGELAQAIEAIMKENPSATVLVDSATELVYTLGFERVFALLRSLSEAVSSHGEASVVVLVNKKAHESRIIEAIISMANEFVD